MNSALLLAKYLDLLKTTRGDRLGGELTHPLPATRNQYKYQPNDNTESIYIYLSYSISCYVQFDWDLVEPGGVVELGGW
jgi:hypothetical protein